MNIFPNAHPPLKDLNLLAHVSHEIRNPLHTIIGLSQLMQDGPSEEDQKEYIQGLLETSQTLLGIVNDIMDYSKLNSGKFHIEEKPADLRKMAQRSLSGLKAMARAKELDLEIQLDEKLPSLLLLDPVKISQVVVNLVSNAIKFTETGKILVLIEVQELYPSEAKVRFAVRDTGIGIPENDIRNIFKPFDQGTREIHPKYGGTGLGLSISKGLVNIMGGELEVESVMGEGSEFSFSLTLGIQQNSVLPSSGGFTEIRPKNLRVLVVDDNKLNRKVVQKNLERLKFEYDLAENGQQALQKVQQQHFDIVLMDVHMPEMDGLTATSEIRKIGGKFLELPIIALSAIDDELYLEKIKAAGMTDFLTKPFRPIDLQNKLVSYSK